MNTTIRGRLLTQNSDHEFKLSNGVFVYHPDPMGRGHYHRFSMLQPGALVRLISGIDEANEIPGYHFSKGWATVCRLDATTAEWLGVLRSELEPHHGDPGF